MGFFDRLRKMFQGQSVGPDAAVQMLADDPDIVIIDVRQDGEYRGGHLRDAVHVPVGLMSKRCARLDKDKTYLVYCKSGARSSRAVSVMRANGIKNVLNLRGGITSWQRAGHPVVKR